MIKLSYHCLYFMITWFYHVVLQAHIFTWNDLIRVYHIRFHTSETFDQICHIHAPNEVTWSPIFVNKTQSSHFAKYNYLRNVSDYMYTVPITAYNNELSIHIYFLEKKTIFNTHRSHTTVQTDAHSRSTVIWKTKL
jgi:hypothetical protein